MGKFVAHDEFGINAPVNYREDTTSEPFLKGMSATTSSGLNDVKRIHGRR